MSFDARFKEPQNQTPEGLRLWAQGLIRELRKGITAERISYDNTSSGLSAETVQSALDEISAAVAAQRVETWSWTFQDVEEVDRRLIINLPYGGVINSITTVCEAGTATVTGKINTTALGGTANSASTSEQTQGHTTDNAFAAGDDFRLEFSSVSGCEWLTVTVKVTRAI